MKTKGKQKRRQRKAPVVDGDSRPDANLYPEDKPNKDIERLPGEGKTTQNRVDGNDLEDFRDSR